MDCLVSTTPTPEKRLSKMQCPSKSWQWSMKSFVLHFYITEDSIIHYCNGSRHVFIEDFAEHTHGKTEIMVTIVIDVPRLFICTNLYVDRHKVRRTVGGRWSLENIKIGAPWRARSKVIAMNDRYFDYLTYQVFKLCQNAQNITINVFKQSREHIEYSSRLYGTTLARYGVQEK